MSKQLDGAPKTCPGGSRSFSWPKKLDSVDLGKPIDRKMVIDWDELPKLNPPVDWDFEAEGGGILTIGTCMLP